MTRDRKPRLGQVFLQDTRIERRIIDALHLQPGDAVLEIGAGPGNMTARLADAGASVAAVELDPKWAAALRLRFAERPEVKVVEADILDVSASTVARNAGEERIKVFGNVPYYITSPILLHLFRDYASIEEIVVMVQLEVAHRIVAKPGDEAYGLLSVTCQYYSEPRLLFPIPARAFRPAPKVDSALVRMKIEPLRDALGVENEAEFWKWLRAAFAQKRKTLVNNWKTLCDPDMLRTAMEQAGVDPRARAEALSLAQLAALFRSARP